MRPAKDVWQQPWMLEILQVELGLDATLSPQAATALPPPPIPPPPAS